MLLTGMLLSVETKAQKIELLPLPGAVGSDYIGSPIVYDSALYLWYTISGLTQLVKYEDDTFTIIPNPEGMQGESSVFRADPIIYKDKLYLEYVDTNARSKLVEYSNDSLRVIAFTKGSGVGNPNYLSLPVIYRNRLYLQSGRQLAVFDGDSLNIIPNPEGYRKSVAGYIAHPIVYNDRLFLKYRHENNSNDLLVWNDTTLVAVPTPEEYHTPFYGYYGSASVFAGKLYLGYADDLRQRKLAIYENGKLQFLDNPPGFREKRSGVFAAKFLVDGQLYFDIVGPEENNFLATLQDAVFSVIPNPMGFNGPGAGIAGDFVQINDKTVYVGIYDDQYNMHIASFDGQTQEVLPYPDNFSQGSVNFIDYPFLFDGKACFRYRNYDAQDKLLIVDHDEIRVIDHPPGATETGTYLGDPIAYRGQLYLRYRNDDGDIVLARLTDVPTPASIPVVSNDFSLFPNPSTGKRVQLRLDNSKRGKTIIQVWDMNGRRKFQKTVEKPANVLEETLSLHGLETGMYTVRILQQEGAQAVNRLVLTR